MVSPFFGERLSLLQSSDNESVDGLPVVRLSEDAELLNSLVSMLYPVYAVEPKTYEKVLDLLAACKKYDMVQVQFSIREKVKWRAFPALSSREGECFGAYAIARSKGLTLEMEEAARSTLRHPMTFETLGKGLRLFNGPALRDLAQFRRRCTNNIVKRLKSFLDIHAASPSSIWLGCPDVMPNRSRLDSSSREVLPSWLCQFLSRMINNLQLRAFTDSLSSLGLTIDKEYSTALRSHPGCKFCSKVDSVKGSTFRLEIWGKWNGALDEVPISLPF